MYVQSDTLLLADVFETFRDMCIKVYGLDLVYFLSAPGLVWQACLKKAGVKLEPLKKIDILLMVEEVEYVILYIDMLWQIINI